MQWFIIGRDMHVLCVSSTDLQESLPIDDSSGGQEIVITNNVAVGTYDFTTDPKHEDAIYITEGNYIAFRDKYGKDRLYTIMSIDGEDSWDVHCEDIGLDLINEDATSWDYTGNPKTIEETLAPVIYDSGWEIGINEISESKRATKFEGRTDSQLTRIGDICGNFECECEFEIEMKGANVTKQTINIYKTLGQDMTQQRFVDGINLISLRKSGSIEDLITCIRCYGREDVNGNQITIADIEYDDGDFYTPKGDIRIYSREARKKWSRFRAWNYEGQGEFDGYINGTFEYDTDSPQELFNRGLSELKERCEKKVSYEAKLYDLKSDIGDTIRIADNRFAEKVYLEARIQAVKNHYSVQGEDTGTLANYKILFSRPADAVKEALDKFKNQIVTILSSDVSYQVSDSGTEIPTDEWVENPPDVPEGKYLWSKTVIRYSGGKETVTYSVSRNGLDGKPGKDGTSIAILGSYNSEEELIQNHPTGNKGDAYIVSGDLYVWNGESWENVGKIQGPQGTPGIPGEDGKTPYIHIKYSNDGGKTFTGNNGEDPGDWIGQYTDFELNDSTNPGDYTWSKIKGDKGEKGDQGLQGLQGEKGDQGIPGKDGIDGKTSYTHIAYANSADGSQDFSVSDPNRDYIGMYVDFIQTDSNNYRDYAWSKIKGADGSQGIPGKPGTDGKTPYLHIAYANSADGSIDFSKTDSTDKLYIGQYTDYISSDSEDPSDYAWTRIKGDKGDPGIQGPAGENGKTTYFHVKYSANANGYPMSETPNVYIGTYVDFDPLDSNDYRDYTWSRFQGTDGIPGVNGEDGKTSYLHIKYSNDGGSTFTGNNGETAGSWLGQYVDFISTDSTNPKDYTWSKIEGGKGEDGLPGSSYNLLKNSNVPVTSTTYRIGEWEMTRAPKPGEKWTLVAELSYDNSSADGRVDWYVGQTMSKVGTFYSEKKNRQIVVAHGQGPTNEIVGNWLRLYNYPSGSQITATVYWICMYEGYVNPSMFWTPTYEETIGVPGEDGKMLYATSNTEPDDPNKFAFLKEGEFSLYVGATVTVRFANENIVERPMLNVNGTGLKPIFTQGLPNAYWVKGSSVVFVYDGTNWQVASAPVYASKATIGNPSAANVFIDGSTVSVRQAEENRFTFGSNDFRNYIKGDYVYIGSKAPEESGSSESPHIEFKSDGVHTEEGKIATYKYFSEDETITSDVWINGKTIYQKVIQVGSISSEAKTIAHGITNIDRVWIDTQNSFLVDTSNITHQFPRVSYRNVNQNVSGRASKTYLYIEAGTDANFEVCYITLRYTKL